MKLSVIVPVYNIEKYVGKCLESLIESDVQDAEFIIVNDGSSDGSLDVIKSYAALDERIVIIDKKNGGCASARNAGIVAAKGEYIGFVDGDDYIDSNQLTMLLNAAYEADYDYVYCGYKEYYEDTEMCSPVLNDKLGEPYIRGTTFQSDIFRLVVNTRVAIWRAIYRRSVLIENNIRFHEDLKRFDDLPFRVEFIYAAHSAKCVPEYLYYYRLGRKGQDVSCTDDGLYVHFDIFRHLDEYVDIKSRNINNNQNLMRELLQVVKICTHGFALSVIDNNYKSDYCARAREDLKRNYSYFKTIFMILKYTGKSHIFWYTKLMLGLL